MTPDEVAHFKRQIMNQILQAKIRIYEFPDEGDLPATNGESRSSNGDKIKERVPFAVVGSNCLIEGEGGKKIRGRKYPWGIVDVSVFSRLKYCRNSRENAILIFVAFSRVFIYVCKFLKIPFVFQIENMDHCDFLPLRNTLIRTHLQDLKEVTNNVHYENFRCRKLAGVAGGSTEKIPNKVSFCFPMKTSFPPIGKDFSPLQNPLAQIEEEKKEHQNKMLKMEKEMEEVFERKVREKQQKLKDSEDDLERRHKESMDKLEQQKRELEARLAAFDQEKAAWEQINGVSVEELKRLSMESLDGKKKKSGGLSGVSFRMGR